MQISQKTLNKLAEVVESGVCLSEVDGVSNDERDGVNYGCYYSICMFMQACTLQTYTPSRIQSFQFSVFVHNFLVIITEVHHALLIGCDKSHSQLFPVLPDTENIWVTVGLSLLSCIQVEISVS